MNRDKTRDNDKAHIKSVSDRENDSRTHNGPADIADENQKGGTDARRADSRKIMYKNGIGKDGAVSIPNGSSFNSRLAL